MTDLRIREKLKAFDCMVWAIEDVIEYFDQQPILTDDEQALFDVCQRVYDTAWEAKEGKTKGGEL